MLIAGIALGLVLGLLLGGRLEHLADIRLRLLPLLFLAVILRFGTEIALATGDPTAELLRLPLLGLAYLLLLFTLWRNRTYPGLALAFVGIASNAVVIAANGGRMPVWLPAYRASGLEGELASVLHVGFEGTGTEFIRRLGPLSDVIPIPFPPFQNVASIGDLFLTAGLAFFLFATLIRTPEEAQAAIDEARRGWIPGRSGPGRGEPGGLRAGTGLTPLLEEAATLERPLVMGAGVMGMATPATVATGAADAGVLGIPLPEAPRAGLLRRVREHPYVRLSLNGSFSALWTGQVISLFGDRVNQIALGAFVFEVTDSPVAVALTFFVATIPNLVFSPIAGALVDRWNHKQVLIVSDILRAALVLLVPVAVLVNVWLAYPLIFLITTVSLFFRPARAAILPRLVPERDLLAANSAMWVGETLADVVNYPIAGLFVVFLASSLPVAFWFDAATYLVSAALLLAIVVPARSRDTIDESTEEAEPRSSLGADLRAGWSFLRRETVLLANTLQGTAGQFAVGVMTVASIVLAKEITPGPAEAYRATYAFMETAIGVGNLVGGFALGLLATRIRKGLMVIWAYTAFGLLVVLLGIAPSVPLVLGILFGCGIANMAFVIPSQTLFQERTPPELMGRVVSLRFALVFGGMSIAMAVGGLLVDVFGAGPVISAAGVLSLVAGLAGLFVRSVRNA